MDPITCAAAGEECRGRDLTRDFRIRHAEHASPMRRRLLARPGVVSEPSGKPAFKTVVLVAKLSSSLLPMILVTSYQTGVALPPCQ